MEVHQGERTKQVLVVVEVTEQMEVREEPRSTAEEVEEAEWPVEQEEQEEVSGEPMANLGGVDTGTAQVEGEVAVTAQRSAVVVEAAVEDMGLQ